MGPIMPGLHAVVEAGPQTGRERLVAFRAGLYQCFPRRADALFELADAVLTADGPVCSLVELSCEKAFRRGHGALYDGLACGRVDSEALGALLAESWEVVDDGPVKIAVDVSAWDRPDAVTSRGLAHCHTACRCDGVRKTVPGWPYSFAAGLEWGGSSWTALLDAVRLDPDGDATAAAVAQVKRVTENLDAAGALTGRPASVFVFDSGYDLTRIAYLVEADGLDVQVLGRVRSDRVFFGPGGTRKGVRGGRVSRHGARLELSAPKPSGKTLTPKPATPLPDADERLEAVSPRYGGVAVTAWHGWHQKLSGDGGWVGHAGQLPIVAGTVIRIEVDHLPGDRAPKPMWLWHRAPVGAVFDLDLLWKAYLRRFDIEHTFRLIKGLLGWTCPQIRTPEQADRWTTLILAAHAQLRLARTLTGDLRHRWEKKTPDGKPMTPGRVRRSFRGLRRTIGTPARPPKPSKAGPGRPAGTTRPPRTRHPVGKKKEKQETSPVKDSDQGG